VLFMPHMDVLAHTGRSLLVAQALRARGAEAVFAGAGKYARLVREAGFEVHDLPEITANQLVAESRRGRRWPFHSPEQVRPFVAAEMQLLRRVQPALVVFDHRYTAGISAEIAGLKRVSITNIWWTPWDAAGMGLAETHPLFATFPRLRFIRRFGWADPLGDYLASVMFRRWTKPYNIVRAEHGLPPLASILDLFAGDAVILPDIPQLAPAHDLPPHAHYVGPLVWEPQGALPVEVDRMDEFVYVSMGSSADPGVFDKVVEALELLDGVPALVTTGGVRDPGEFARAPARIAFYDFLPGSAAALRASAVVCQGGIGTIYQALAAGKPLVGIPFMPEQEVCGIGTVAKAGAGIALSPLDLTAQKLAGAIETITAESRYRDAARNLSRDIDLAQGPVKSADIISGLL
jgi:UDP:flavonoid glycosyltransferase YjiC (YdhE family)